MLSHINTMTTDSRSDRGSNVDPPQASLCVCKAHTEVHEDVCCSFLHATGGYRRHQEAGVCCSIMHSGCCKGHLHDNSSKLYQG